MYETAISIVVAVLNGALAIKYWASCLRLNQPSVNLQTLWTIQRLLPLLFITPAVYLALCEAQLLYSDLDIAYWLQAIKDLLCSYHVYIFFRILILAADCSLTDILFILHKLANQRGSDALAKVDRFRRAYLWTAILVILKPLLSLGTAVIWNIQRSLPGIILIVNLLITALSSVPLAYYIIFLVRSISPITKLVNPMMKVSLVLLLVPLLGLEYDIFQLLSHFGVISGEPEYAYLRGNELFTRTVSIQLLIVSVLYWRGIFWSVNDLEQVFQERANLLVSHPKTVNMYGEWKESSGSLEPAVIGRPRSMDLDKLALELNLDPFSSGSNNEGDLMSLLNT